MMPATPKAPQGDDYETREVTQEEIERASVNALRRAREHVREPVGVTVQASDHLDQLSEVAEVSDEVGDGYTGPQVCAITGITYRQLDYWARTGLLHPSITGGPGSGSQRRYSYTDLVQLKVIQRLLDSGVSLESARRAVEALRSAGEDLATANLVIDGRRSILSHSGEEIIDLLRGGQTVLNIVPLGGVLDEIAAGITKLSRHEDTPD
jgi:DNA-binding transcriptional MerR regulator